LETFCGYNFPSIFGVLRFDLGLWPIIIMEESAECIY
jgi:hypothetical protein